MRRFMVVSAVFIFALTMLAGSMDAQTTADDYKSKCQMCHGTAGLGDTPMGKKLNVRDFHSPDVQKKTDDEFLKAIREGVNSSGKLVMPAYNGKLSDVQMRDLAKYSRDLGKK